MKELLTRTISGIMIVLIVLGSILLAGYSMLALILVIFSFALLEFRTMFGLKNQVLFFMVLAGGQLILILGYLAFAGILGYIYLSAGTAILLSFMLLLSLLSGKISIRETGHYLFSLTWVAGTLLLFLALGWKSKTDTYHPLMPLLLIIMIWVYDIGAYVFGSLLGKTPMAPKISPGKSWEGFVAGILLNGIAGLLVFRITGLLDLGAWLILSLIVSLGATAGDLLESKLKREAGVKDSGHLIPGHGGMLDRFDSLLISAPLFYIFLQIFSLS